MSYVTWSIRVLSAIASALSLASLVSKLFSIGLQPTFDLIVQSYREFWYPLANFVPELFHITLPHFYLDALTISIIMGGSLIRAGWVRGGNPIKLTINWTLTVTFILTALIVPLGLAFTYRAIRESMHDHYRNQYGLFLVNLFGGLFGAILFFVLNAYL